MISTQMAAPHVTNLTCCEIHIHYNGYGRVLNDTVTETTRPKPYILMAVRRIISKKNGFASAGILE